METHISAAAEVLAPGGSLDAIGFACTSGPVAIGADVVRAKSKRHDRECRW